MNNDPSIYKRRLPWTWLVFLISASALAAYLIIFTRLAVDSNNTESTIFWLNFLAFFGTFPGMILAYLWAAVVVGSYVYLHYLYAKSKGYPASLTLLFVINTIGLAILILLPDRTKKAS